MWLGGSKDTEREKEYELHYLGPEFWWERFAKPALSITPDRRPSGNIIHCRQASAV